MRSPLFSRLLPILICSLTLVFAVSGQCLNDQHSYLLELKNTLKFDSDFSTKLVRWNESVDCCSWEGVTCSEGRVVGLYLDDESISGGVLDSASTLIRLHYLQDLNLAYNYFDGSHIPPAFGNLTNLSYLNLSNAGFSGQIPIEISRLTRLVTLDLSSNLLDMKLENPNLATLVQNLTRLTELHLDYVIISSQGNEWCQVLSSSLPNLRVLSMSGCDLPGPLDSSLQKLQSLSIIDLSMNDFNAPVPEFFADFRNLTFLDLSYCGLNGQFPKKILQIPTMQTVDLSDNELLQGSLPEFYPNGSLQSLRLTGTKFSGTLPDSIGNLKRLTEIDLSGCNFNGSIPNSMANLTQLVYLAMPSNYFTGPIPSRMAKNLTMINLSNNHLTGQITFSYWKELQSLMELYLSYNSLEGSIPVSLFFLPSLQKLHLGNNHFSGQLREFPNVSSFLLEELDLSSNYLEGPIPISIFELQGLRTLSLSSNNFNGSLQVNVNQQLRNLTNLDLSNNNLLIEYNETSSSLSPFPQLEKLVLASNKLKIFPEFLRNQANLHMLDLSNNQIHGEIPNWFWKLPSLRHVNLSYNYLEGPLLNFPSLGSLDLHSNQLHGQLPTPLPFFIYLDLSRNNFNLVLPTLGLLWNAKFRGTFLSLSSNKFHGQIPESICNATSLRLLDLSNNSLNGTIPQCFSSMSNLEVLNLRRNNLTGKMSDTFPSDCSLQTLNVNKNLLEGVVPKSLANCINLEVLDIGNNRIHDAFPCYLKRISNLRVLVLQSNKFYGSVGCRGTNVTWPMLQIVDLASNNFSGMISIKALANSKAMMVDNEAHSELNYLHSKERSGMLEGYYQDVITITIKGQVIELVKILTMFTSIDLSCNNLEGPIPEEIGEFKSLHNLNLSHNAFTGQIPPSLGKLSQLESLDLSSNKLTGEIPVQLADGLIFLSVLNLSFNQLAGRIPNIKQFATFSETSYEGNKGLYGCPLKTKCTSAEPSSPPPTFKDSHSNSRPLIDWNFVSVELGFVSGFGMIIWPIVFFKRWRIRYYKHVDDILFRIFPRLYLGGKQYRGIRAQTNAGRRQ